MLKKRDYWAPLATLILAVAMLLGCGSESGIGGDDSIGVELTAHDNGSTTGDGTSTIDVIRSDCETGGGEDAESSAEPFYDTLGKARFTYFPQCTDCPEGATEAYIINGYTVAYIPIQSPDGQGGAFTPPALVNLSQKVLSQIILSRDFTTVERSFILVPIGTKNEYRNKVSAQGRTVPGLYSVRATFFGRSRTGGDFSLTSTLELSFGNYDACGEN